jgi:hypothetical protein
LDTDVPLITDDFTGLGLGNDKDITYLYPAIII